MVPASGPRRLTLLLTVTVDWLLVRSTSGTAGKDDREHENDQSRHHRNPQADNADIG